MKGLFSGGENSLSHINAGVMISLKNVSILCGESGQATRINQAITQFVWNNKVKIKYRTLIGQKEQGGLDMRDFQIINDALEVVFVRRLSESNIYQLIFTKTLCTPG